MLNEIENNGPSLDTARAHGNTYFDFACDTKTDGVRSDAHLVVKTTVVEFT